MIKNNKTIGAGILILFTLVGFDARAVIPAGTPVIDAGAIAKLDNQLKAMRKQYDLMNRTYQNAQNQLDATKKLQSLNSGHYQFGNLNNSMSHLKARQWSPNSWDDALKNIAGGNPQRYQSLVRAYEQNHRTMKSRPLLNGENSYQFKQYQQNRAVNQAVSVQTTYAFDDINEHLKAVHELSEQIEKTENTKAALDLNSRLMAEMAYIQIQTLKLQTLISQQTAQVNASELDDTVEWAEFNRID